MRLPCQCRLYAIYLIAFALQCCLPGARCIVGRFTMGGGLCMHSVDSGGCRGALLSLLATFAVSSASAQQGAPVQARTNAFNDPFVQVTRAITHCPVPEGPLYTEAEVRELAHV